MTDQEKLDGARWLLREYKFWADGHALRSCGAHTGHIVMTFALFETSAMATAVAETLEATKNKA